MTKVTDRCGHEFLFAHSKEGHLRRYTEPATHDPEGNPSAEATETTWRYASDDGLPTEVQLPDGRVMQTRYVAQPDQRAGATARPNVAKASQIPHSNPLGDDSEGAVALCQLPAPSNGSSDAISWEFEDYHYRSHRAGKVKSPRGHEISSSFNGDPGLVKISSQSVKDPNTLTEQQSTTHFDRDPHGLVKKTTVESGGGVVPETTMTFKETGEKTSRIESVTVKSDASSSLTFN